MIEKYGRQCDVIDLVLWIAIRVQTLHDMWGSGKERWRKLGWYEKLNYTETKDIIKEKLQNMSRDFVAIGFYLKLIRDKKLIPGRWI